MTLPAGDPTLVSRLRAALAAREDLLEAYLFGSRARGDAAAHSDVDIAVFFDPETGEGPPGLRAAELAADLCTALATNELDVVALNTAPPLLYHRVLRDGELLVSRDERATTRRAGQALSRYCDYVPHLAKIEAAHRLRVEAGEFGR